MGVMRTMYRNLEHGKNKPNPKTMILEFYNFLDGEINICTEEKEKATLEKIKTKFLILGEKFNVAKKSIKSYL
jgi:hypothetical protein